MLDVANLAEENILHQPLSEALYDAAASFVKKAEGLENMLERMLDIFTDENEDHAVVVFKVIKRAKKMKSGNCSNCNQASCLNGQRLLIQNFAPGAKVRLGGCVRRLIRIEDGSTFSACYDDENGFMDRFKFHLGVYMCS